MTPEDEPDAAPRVCVVYYSATGTVAALAHALADGARASGAHARVRRVAETAPASAVDANPRWREFADTSAGPAGDRVVELDDLTWADGLAFGSPTRFGGPASQLKAFLDTTGSLWFRGDLADKVCTSFTAASTLHGGLESTVLAINNHFYHWGSLVMPLGYQEPHVARQSGNPYGASFVSRSSAPVDEVALEAARLQGARLARIAGQLRGTSG